MDTQDTADQRDRLPLRSCRSGAIDGNESLLTVTTSDEQLVRDWRMMPSGVRARMKWLGHASVAAQYAADGHEPITVGYDLHFSTLVSPMGGPRRLIPAPFTADQAARLGLFDVICISHDHCKRIPRLVLEQARAYI